MDKHNDELRWGMIKRPNNGLKAVDLFCGAGIGASGVLLAGYDIKWAVDIKDYAVDTYNKNIGNHAVVRDIRKVTGEDIPDHDLMIATPVCKSFSFSGNMKGVEDEKYGDLSYHFYRLLGEKKPKAFLFENVNGMVSKKHKPFFDGFIKLIEELGYKVYLNLVDVYEYGVPQHRKRIFAVGIRNDIKKEFKFPERVEIEDRTNLRQAIGDLPEPDKVMNSNKDIQFVNVEKTTIENHIGYGVRNDEKPFIDKVPVGGNWKDLSEEDAKKFMGKAYNSGGGRTGFLRKVSFDKPAYTITSMMNGKNNAQIIDNQDKYYDGGFSPRYVSRNRQKQWEEPSYTIVSEARQLPLYPEPANYDIRKMKEYDVLPPRRFTVRECLRIQTVPDWFSFDENIDLKKQYERCSGIPSLMAYKIVIAIEECIL